jgi:SAM-dependent methyltransferase
VLDFASDAAAVAACIFVVARPQCVVYFFIWLPVAMGGSAIMDEDPSEIVRSFFDNYGWVEGPEGLSGEEKQSRRFRPAYRAYTRGSAERTLACFRSRTGTSLFAGCGDMPETHVRLARQFSKIYCMDISRVALERARERLGGSAAYLLESITETKLEDNSVDAVYCAHVIYHIGRALQERAVQQLIRVTRRGGRIVVIYANPGSPFTFPGAMMRWAKRLRSRNAGALTPTWATADAVPELYYHVNPLRWWRRFEGNCRIEFLPWEIIGSRPASALLWSDGMASAFYRAAGWAEARVPALAVRLWQYPIIVLDKKKAGDRQGTRGTPA